MHNLNGEKNNSKVIGTTTTATSFILLGTILVIATISTAPFGALASRFEAEGGGEGFIDPTMDNRKAPAIVSGDNIYIAWWTNNTENGNEEVLFRASSDGGATFTDKINLSNTTEADSWRVEIHGEGDTVAVSWWETNQTGSDIPVARVSNDAGATFGPMMMLGMNGTIGATGEEGEGEGTTATFGEEGEG